MLPLFIYGTLRHPEIREAVLQKQDHMTGYQFEPAMLDGYEAYYVAGTAYPMLVHEDGAYAAGQCWYGLKPEDVAILDRFEGAYYERVQLSVSLTKTKIVQEVEVYMPNIALPQGPLWQFESWQKTGSQSFLSQDFNPSGVRAPNLN